MMGKSHLAVNTCALFGAVSAAAFLGFGYLGPGYGYTREICLKVNYFLYPRGGFSVVFRSVLYLAAYFFGTLLPDIDSETSTLGRHVYLPVGHRTWTHTLWAVLLFTVPGLFVHPVFLFLAFGYALHLLCDSVSYQGVCWLYPFSKYKEYSSGAKVKINHKYKWYRAGKTSEGAVAACLCLAGVAAGLVFGFWLDGLSLFAAFLMAL